VKATAIKNVSLAEEHFHDHWLFRQPGHARQPHGRGMAQPRHPVGAAELSGKSDPRKSEASRFEREVRPGQQLRYEATIEQVSPEAASTVGKVFADGEPLGVVDIVFSHIDNNLSGLEFPEENFVFTYDFKALLRTYNVSRNK
jgi:hypothetical protein